MDRIIEVKVNGNYISKDNKNAGVRGEGNATNLRITFDEGWSGYAKTVTFWDALGNNPVKRVVTEDLLEDNIKSINVYLVPIPAEAMAEAGSLTFVIDGYADGKRQRSISDTLVVKDAPMAENAAEPTDPMPEVYEQIQQQIDKILPDMQAERIATQTARTDAEEARDEAIISADNAKASEESSSANSNKAIESARIATEALGKLNCVGDNGNWFVWDSSTNGYKDTGVKAQGESGVYLGSNPPESANVWIYPDGNAIIYATAEDVKALRELLYDVANKVAQTRATVTVYANKWTPDTNYKDRWYQVVTVNGAEITNKSEVNVFPSGDMLDEMYERLVTVYAEQENGVVKVYCKGRTLLNTYTMKVSVSEVEVNE